MTASDLDHYGFVRKREHVSGLGKRRHEGRLRGHDPRPTSHATTASKENFFLPWPWSWGRRGDRGQAAAFVKDYHFLGHHRRAHGAESLSQLTTDIWKCRCPRGANGATPRWRTRNSTRTPCSGFSWTCPPILKSAQIIYNIHDLFSSRSGFAVPEVRCLDRSASSARRAHRRNRLGSGRIHRPVSAASELPRSDHAVSHHPGQVRDSRTGGPHRNTEKIIRGKRTFPGPLLHSGALRCQQPLGKRPETDYPPSDRAASTRDGCYRHRIDRTVGLQGG